MFNPKISLVSVFAITSILSTSAAADGLADLQAALEKLNGSEPITAYYESRFIKVAQAMANIDKVVVSLCGMFCSRPEFAEIAPLLDDYASAAKHECETMKSDVCIFNIWPEFVAAGEALGAVQAEIQVNCSRECYYVMEEAQKTLVAGRNLINWVARARVPMPHSTKTYLARIESLKQRMTSC